MRNLIQIPGTRDAPRARFHAQVREFLESTECMEPEAVSEIAGVSAATVERWRRAPTVRVNRFIRERMQRYLDAEAVVVACHPAAAARVR